MPDRGGQRVWCGTDRRETWQDVSSVPCPSSEAGGLPFRSLNRQIEALRVFSVAFETYFSLSYDLKKYWFVERVKIVSNRQYLRLELGSHVSDTFV